MWHMLQAFAIGFAIAVVTESMAILSLKRTIQQGFVAGFASGLGVATADGTFSAVALLGLTSISAPLLNHRRWLELAGGSLLLWLGWRCFAFRSLKLEDAKPSGASYVNYFISCFAIMSAHPMTIILYTTIFTPIAAGLAVRTKIMMAASVFIGSLSWWIILSAVGRRLQANLIEKRMRFALRICGSLLVARGLWLLKTAANT